MAIISVVIPAYNQATYLSHAIRSVLGQSFSDFELVVINDGSTDHTQEVLRSFVDPRLKAVWQENGGSIAARNTGLRLTTAPYVSFLDADDLFLPNSLASLYTYLEDHPEVGIVAGGTQYIDLNGKVLNERISKPSNLQLRGILLENPITTGGVLIRRKWIDRVGGFDPNRQFNECEDWDLWLRLAKAECQIEWLEKLVVAYRIHPGQLTQNPQQMRKGALELLDAFYSQNDLSPELVALKDRAYALVFIRSAARAFLANQVETGKQDLATAAKIDPSLKDKDFRELVDQLVGWAHSPQSSDPEAFIININNNLPPSLDGMKPALRKAIAAVILGPIFKGIPQHNHTNRESIIRAIHYDPTWLLNRGVLRRLADTIYSYRRRIE